MTNQTNRNEIRRTSVPGLVMYFQPSTGKHSIATFPEDSAEYSAAKGGYLNVKVDELEKWIFLTEF